MKTMIAYKKGEYGFNERIGFVNPFIPKSLWGVSDCYPEFGDSNVKDLLDRAAREGGWVVLINETPRTYKSEEVVACPTCGWPMRGECRRWHREEAE